MKHTVALDLDAVLADYSQGWRGVSEIGDPIPNAVQFTKELSEFSDVVIFTCRCCEEITGRNGMKAYMLRNIVAEWLDKHGFTYADIYVGQGKPIASAYIDDRAVTCRPMDFADTKTCFDITLEATKRLCKVIKEEGKE